MGFQLGNRDRYRDEVFEVQCGFSTAADLSEESTDESRKNRVYGRKSVREIGGFSTSYLKCGYGQIDEMFEIRIDSASVSTPKKTRLDSEVFGRRARTIAVKLRNSGTGGPIKPRLFSEEAARFRDRFRAATTSSVRSLAAEIEGKVGLHVFSDLSGGVTQTEGKTKTAQRKGTRKRPY